MDEVQLSYTSKEVDMLLRNLNERFQADYMHQWFTFFYVDPAQEIPLDNESEYGYAFIWGGPFFAEEELRERFETIVDELAIESVLEDVSKLGFVWAPTWEHPNHEGNKILSDPDDSEP